MTCRLLCLITFDHLSLITLIFRLNKFDFLSKLGPLLDAMRSICCLNSIDSFIQSGLLLGFQIDKFTLSTHGSEFRFL